MPWKYHHHSNPTYISKISHNTNNPVLLIYFILFICSVRLTRENTCNWVFHTIPIFVFRWTPTSRMECLLSGFHFPVPLSFLFKVMKSLKSSTQQGVENKLSTWVTSLLVQISHSLVVLLLWVVFQVSQIVRFTLLSPSSHSHPLCPFQHCYHSSLMTNHVTLLIVLSGITPQRVSWLYMF
jgi:hypothetical protein